MTRTIIGFVLGILAALAIVGAQSQAQAPCDRFGSTWDPPPVRSYDGPPIPYGGSPPQLCTYTAGTRFCF